MISRDFLRHETKYLFFPSNWHIFFLVKDRYMMRSDSKKKCVVNNIPLKKYKMQTMEILYIVVWVIYCVVSRATVSATAAGIFRFFSTFKYLRAILWGPLPNTLKFLGCRACVHFDHSDLGYPFYLKVYIYYTTIFIF